MEKERKFIWAGNPTHPAVDLQEFSLPVQDVTYLTLLAEISRLKGQEMDHSHGVMFWSNFTFFCAEYINYI
jgi:hypothetical protein